MLLSRYWNFLEGGVILLYIFLVFHIKEWGYSSWNEVNYVADSNPINWNSELPWLCGDRAFQNIFNVKELTLKPGFPYVFLTQHRFKFWPLKIYFHLIYEFYDQFAKIVIWITGHFPLAGILCKGVEGHWEVVKLTEQSKLTFRVSSLYL